MSSRLSRHCRHGQIGWTLRMRWCAGSLLLSAVATARSDEPGGFTPEEAARRMVVPPGFPRRGLRGRADGPPAGVGQLRRARAALGHRVFAISQPGRAQAGHGRPVPPHRVRPGARAAPARPAGRRPDQDPRRHRRRRPGRQGEGLRRGPEPRLGPGRRPRRRLRRPGPVSPVLPRSKSRRPARRRPRGPARPASGFRTPTRRSTR